MDDRHQIDGQQMASASRNIDRKKPTDCTGFAQQALIILISQRVQHKPASNNTAVAVNYAPSSTPLSPRQTENRPHRKRAAMTPPTHKPRQISEAATKKYQLIIKET